VVNQVGLEVDNALVEVNRTRERMQASAKSVAAAEARMAAAEGKYQQGVGILLEVIDARVAVTRALADQVRARYDYQIALVALDRAQGTLPVPATPLPESVRTVQ
jgi:outer membrane protein TolC